MPKLEIEIDEEMLAQLQRLAARDGTPLEAAVVNELKVTLDRQPTHLAYPFIEIFANMEYGLHSALNILNMYATLIDEGVLASSEGQLRRAGSVLMRQGRRLNVIFDYLRSLAKIERGEMQPLFFEEVDLLALLQEVVAEFEAHFELLSALPMIQGEAFHLRRVFHALLDNLPYPVKDVTVSAQSQPGIVILTIQGKQPTFSFMDWYLRDAGVNFARYVIERHSGSLSITGDDDLRVTITLPIQPKAGDGGA